MEDKYKELIKIWGEQYNPIVEELIRSFKVRFDLTGEEYQNFCEWTEKND